MQLNNEQLELVKQWIAEGNGLSDIQKRLREELDISMTYMDVRFLVLDLGLALREDQESKPVQNANLETAVSSAEASGPAEDALASGVSVEIDRVLKPGALISGTVRFSDGVSADWALDQMGRIAINARQPGYRPSQEDLQAFQQELSRLIQSRGF